MECQTCSEALTAFMDGEMSAEERRFLEEHLDDCIVCKSEHDSLYYAYILVDKAEEVELNPALWRRIESQIEPPRKSFFDFGWLFAGPRAAAMAAGLILLFSIGFFWISTDTESSLERSMISYVSARDRLEFEHEGIYNMEPVGWVSYNPFAISVPPLERNPFETE